MTHDPLCPVNNCMDSNCPECCECALIAKVRANEKAKWTHVCPDNNCCNGGPN